MLSLDVWIDHLNVVPGELDELLAVVQQLLVHELDEERAELEKPHPQALGKPPVAPEAVVNQLTHLFTSNIHKNQSNTVKHTKRTFDIYFTSKSILHISL